MRRVLAIAAPVAVALAATPGAQTSLAESVAASGHVLEYVRGLTAIGPRLTGTPNYTRAADWAAAQLRAAGVERVALEPFTIPDGWERVRASARIASPEALPLRVAALGWTPSTSGVVDAEVVALDDASPDAIASLRGR